MPLSTLSSPSRSGGSSGDFSATAVAIDNDKNAQQAVKWTVDNLLSNNERLTLIHVCLKTAATANFGFSVIGHSAEAAREQTEAEMQQLFFPFKGYCARKGIQMTEVVLEEDDVSKAIIEYISCRKLKPPDVPSSLIKSAPDFCTVHVIYKGKPITGRPAKSVAVNSSMPPRQAMVQGSPQHLSDQEDSIRQNFRGQNAPSLQQERRSFERFSDTNKMSSRDRLTPNNYFLDSLNSSVRLSNASDFRDSFSEDSISIGRQSMDFHETLEFSSCSMDNPGESPTAPEMLRLR